MRTDARPSGADEHGAGYDLLALDLDGTLLNSKGKVSARNAAAVRAARGAGMRVVVCTGRGLIECRFALEAIGQVDPVVVAGGSIIADPASGKTLHRFPMEPGLVRDAAGAILAHGHAALVLKDAGAAGFDYLVVQGEGGATLDPVTEWWFAELKVRVRFAKAIDEDEHPEHTVRVGACAGKREFERLSAHLSEVARDRAVLQHFPAVVGPQHARGDGESIHILEVFDASVTKWAAVARLAQEWGVPARRVAAIGDEINDEPMMTGAGLGIAMGNAVARTRAAANRLTLTNDEDGVAWAIERILAGEW